MTEDQAKTLANENFNHRIQYPLRNNKDIKNTATTYPTLGE